MSDRPPVSDRRPVSGRPPVSDRLPASRIATRILAVSLVVLLAGASALALTGGQVFLGVIGAIGGLLTLWALVSASKAA